MKEAMPRTSTLSVKVRSAEVRLKKDNGKPCVGCADKLKVAVKKASVSV